VANSPVRSCISLLIDLYMGGDQQGQPGQV